MTNIKKSSKLFSAILFLLLTFSFTAILNAADNRLHRINGAELNSLIEASRQTEKSKKLVIVDVREPWNFNKGHIPGAINIQYEDHAHTRVLNELSPKDTIVFVCHGGPMGDDLGDVLIRNNYPNVYNLKGGMYGWSGELEK